MQDFEAFFKTATGGHKPYDYQRRLAPRNPPNKEVCNEQG